MPRSTRAFVWGRYNMRHAYHSTILAFLFVASTAPACAQAPASPQRPPILGDALAALPNDFLGPGKVILATETYTRARPSGTPDTASLTPGDIMVDPLDRISQTFDRTITT